MENQIKHVAARLKVIFVSFWLLPVLLIVVGETGGEARMLLMYVLLILLKHWLFCWWLSVCPYP